MASETQKVIVREGEAWEVEIIGNVVSIYDPTGAKRAMVLGLKQAGCHLAIALDRADELQSKLDDREAVKDAT